MDIIMEILEVGGKIDGTHTNQQDLERAFYVYLFHSFLKKHRFNISIVYRSLVLPIATIVQS